jgi:transposase-like protein
MPWNKTCPMNERQNFIQDWLTRDRSFAAVCENFGISRKTGYKWVERFRLQGNRGLNDKSRKPHSHPRTTESKVEQEILRFRAMHPFWGPRKILGRLERLNPAFDWPAASTIGAILRRYGIVLPRRNAAAPRCTPGRLMAALDATKTIGPSQPD